MPRRDHHPDDWRIVAMDDREKLEQWKKERGALWAEIARALAVPLRLLQGEKDG